MGAQEPCKLCCRPPPTSLPRWSTQRWPSRGALPCCPELWYLQRAPIGTLQHRATQTVHVHRRLMHTGQAKQLARHEPLLVTALLSGLPAVLMCRALPSRIAAAFHDAQPQVQSRILGSETSVCPRTLAATSPCVACCRRPLLLSSLCETLSARHPTTCACVIELHLRARGTATA